MIIAHRGYKKRFKENTIPAFEDALACGADAIETDVRLLSDNTVVVSHDDIISRDGKNIVLSKSSSKDAKGILFLDGLFDYIKQSHARFFLELKDSSPVLLDQVIKKISDNSLWDRVELIGFSNCVKTALAAQSSYPNLLVGQIVKYPFLHYITSPKKSYSVYFGWLDSIKFSEQFFKKIFSEKAVAKLKEKYESLGFKVYAGVINSEEGVRYFYNAGIYDIFTDEVGLANKVLKGQNNLES